MGTIRRVAKNTTLVSAEIVLVNLLSFAFVIYVTRTLGVMEFGKFALAKAFLEILVVWADLGLTKLLIREVARNQEELPSYFMDFVIIKSIYSLITFALIIIFIHLLRYETDVRVIVYILGGAYLVHSMSGMMVSVFQGYERMEFGAYLSVFRSTLLILFGVAVLMKGYGLQGLCVSIFVVNLIHFILSLFLLHNRFVKVVFQIHLSTWKRVVREGFSFGIGSVFVRIFARIDSVMLSKMISMTVVGLYNSAYNIVLVLMFLPGAVSQALFPVTSRYFETDPEKMQSIFERSFKYSVLIGFPMATGIALLAERIISLLYGPSFAEAALALQILIWTLALSFATAMLGNLLNSANRQMKTTYNMMICSVINIGMNLILIPLYGFIGASVATVVTEVILVALSYFAVRKFVYVPKIAMPVMKAVFGSSVMGIAVYLVRDQNLFFSIFLGIVVYILMLILVKVFDREDWNILQKLILVRA